MSEIFTEEETIATIQNLTRTRLISFVQAEIVRPLHTDAGPVFRRVDLVRMELLCELCEVFDLEEDALEMVMSLIDQLHDARRELRVVLDVIEAAGPQDLRMRVGEALRAASRD